MPRSQRLRAESSCCLRTNRRSEHQCADQKSDGQHDKYDDKAVSQEFAHDRILRGRCDLDQSGADMVRLVSATAIGGFFTEALVKSREPQAAF